VVGEGSMIWENTALALSKAAKQSKFQEGMSMIIIIKISRDGDSRILGLDNSPE